MEHQGSVAAYRAHIAEFFAKLEPRPLNVDVRPEPQESTAQHFANPS